MKNYEIDKERFDKMLGQGTPVLLRETNGHTHTGVTDEDGNGTSSRNSGHTHTITNWKVLMGNGHTHSLTRLKEKENKHVVNHQLWDPFYCEGCGQEWLINSHITDESYERTSSKCPECGYKMSIMDYAVWSAKKVNDFPDSSFAWVESGGTKDSEGKTVPRSLRHLPYKDGAGNVDLPHVRNALARLNQVKGMPDAKRNSVRATLQNILKQSKDMETFPTIPYVPTVPFVPIDSGTQPMYIYSTDSGTSADIKLGATAPIDDCGCGDEHKFIVGEEKKARVVYKKGVDFSHGVHSIERCVVVEHEAGKPSFAEIEGILFHRGNHKGYYYTDAELKNATLAPREGQNLVYVNWNHGKDEGGRTGIMSHIWWDEKAKWTCPVNGTSGIGALKFRSIITDGEAIKKIINGEMGQVSAELFFDIVMEDGKQLATEINVVGQAVTNTPALPAAEIDKVCVIDEEGNRVCDDKS